MTKFFKSRNKPKAIPQPTPRSMEEIEKEYNELRARAGDAEYQAFIYNKALAELNNRMLQVNQEGAARKELDAKNNVEKAVEVAHVKS